MTTKMVMSNVEVFETSDLPEVDQAILAARDDNSTDSIETLHISPNEAFGRFKGSYIDSGSVDFSDKLRSSRRKGYNMIWTGEPPKEDETPVKKYQRLNAEVREIQVELAAAKNSKQTGISEATLETITGDVDLLHKQLVQLRLEEVLGHQTVQSMTDPQAATQQKLLSQLEQLKKLPNTDTTAKDSNTPSYSIHLKSAGEPEGALLAELEARLSSVEHIVGMNQDSFSVLCMETNKKNLVQAVQILTSKTSLLDPYFLDHVEGRLGALHQKLVHLQDQRSSLDSDSMTKLDSLLSLAEKSQPMYAALPETVHRVETLQSLHMQAADFSRDLLELETVQEQLTVQLGNNVALLNSTKECFSSNLGNIQKNFSSLFDRIDRLQKKTKK